MDTLSVLQHLTEYWESQLLHISRHPVLNEVVAYMKEQELMPQRLCFSETIDGAPQVFALVINREGEWSGERHFCAESDFFQYMYTPSIRKPDETINRQDLALEIARFGCRNVAVIPDLEELLTFYLRTTRDRETLDN